MFRSLLTLLLLLPLLSRTASAQTADSCDLKIGLVFSGGGAKCLAQIGALKVIDSAGIKVDYIAGTSMGAIIGSMYALGYSVDEIEEYLRKVDWDALLSNEIPHNRLSYFDRKSEARYLLSFPLVEGKLRLPTGLNYAQYILKQLSYLTQQSYRYPTFSDFPIPFLCVATNLENGQMKIFEDGNLTDALRASSAFPSLFTPYEVDGSLYIDGGLVNNYPVKPLRERGMDYIIGIDVQDFLYKKNELNSVMRIMEQTSSFVNASEYLKQLEYTDILIKPDISDAGITSFELFDSLVARGEKAARAQLPALLQLAKRDATPQLNRSKYDAVPLDQFYLHSIEILGLKNSTRSYVLGKLRLDEQQETSIDELERGLDQLYGSKYFTNVEYQLLPADTGYVLSLHVRENPYLSQFRLGLHYDDDFKTALLLNYTHRNFLFRNSRLSAEVAVGDNPRANFNYFIDRGLVPSLGLKVRANRFKTRVYRDGDPISQLQYFDFSSDLFIQSTIYDALAVGGGIQFEGVKISQDLAILGSTDVYHNYLNYYGFLDFDSFNRANYASKGTRLTITGRVISRAENFNSAYLPSSVIDLNYSQAVRFSSRLSMIGMIKGATTIGPNLDYPYNIFLGSMGQNYVNYIFPFIGYRYMELVGRNALLLRTDFYFEIFKKNYIVARGNIGKLESTFDNLFDSKVLLDGFSIGYSFDSPVGPLELNLMGSSNHKGVYTYISLGYWF